LRHVRGEPWRLARLQDFDLYTLCAVIAGSVVAASTATVLQMLIRGSEGLWATWRLWFLATALVHLTLSPALLIWITGGIGWLKSLSPRRWGEACLLSVSLLAIGLSAFGGDTGSPDNLTLLLYAPMPFLLWAAVRFGPRGAATTLTFIACLSIWNAVHGRGPFTEQSPAENVLDLQLFLVVVSVPLLVLAFLIEERQRSTKALRESEERYRAIVEEQTDLVCRYRPDTVLTFVNEAYCHYYGKTREELVGTSFLLLIPEEARQAAAEHVQSLCDHPRIERYEHPVIGPQEGLRWQQWVDRVILDNHGRILELQAVGRDITERKHAEEALCLSDERYALAVNAGKVGVWDWDIRSGVIYLDPNLKALLGYEDDEIPNQLEAWMGQVHPEDRNQVMQVAQACLEGGPPHYEIEHRMLHKHGGIRWFLARGVVFFDANGQPYRMVGTDTDITERRQAEEKRRSAEAKFRAVFDANFVPLFFWHGDGYILEANDAYLRLTGFTRAELKSGQLRWDELMLPEDTHPARRVLTELWAEWASGTSREKVYRLRDGRRIPVLLSGALLAGYTDRGVAYAIDLSERKEAEAALRKAHTELAHAARVMVMGELSASLAHELRQPLTAILSNAQAALRFLTAPSVDLGELRTILADVVADDQRAGEVIDRLRRLLRRDELERLPLDLNDVIQDVVKLIHSEVVIKNVVVCLDLAADLPTVPGDRVQLQQVILNLLINSVEAMSTVEDRRRELLIRSSRDGASGVLVAVRDVGIGLDPGQAERLFDSFYTTKPRGLGLGLSISRSIIEAHGGRLWATPNEGYGTTLQFTLPAAGAPA
jgi:PAS domain S-box-containing protein